MRRRDDSNDNIVDDHYVDDKSAPAHIKLKQKRTVSATVSHHARSDCWLCFLGKRFHARDQEDSTQSSDHPQGPPDGYSADDAFNHVHAPIIPEREDDHQRRSPLIFVPGAGANGQTPPQQQDAQQQAKQQQLAQQPQQQPAGQQQLAQQPQQQRPQRLQQRAPLYGQVPGQSYGPPTPGQDAGKSANGGAGAPNSQTGQTQAFGPPQSHGTTVQPGQQSQPGSDAELHQQPQAQPQSQNQATPQSQSLYPQGSGGIYQLPGSQQQKQQQGQQQPQQQTPARPRDYGDDAIDSAYADAAAGKAQGEHAIDSAQADADAGRAQGTHAAAKANAQKHAGQSHLDHTKNRADREKHAGQAHNDRVIAQAQKDKAAEQAQWDHDLNEDRRKISRDSGQDIECAQQQANDAENSAIPPEQRINSYTGAYSGVVAHCNRPQQQRQRTRSHPYEINDEAAHRELHKNVKVNQTEIHGQSQDPDGKSLQAAGKATQGELAVDASEDELHHSEKHSGPAHRVHSSARDGPYQSTDDAAHRELHKDLKVKQTEIHGQSQDANGKQVQGAGKATQGELVVDASEDEFHHSEEHQGSAHHARSESADTPYESHDEGAHRELHKDLKVNQTEVQGQSQDANGKSLQAAGKATQGELDVDASEDEFSHSEHGSGSLRHAQRAVDEEEKKPVAAAADSQKPAYQVQPDNTDYTGGEAAGFGPSASKWGAGAPSNGGDKDQDDNDDEAKSSSSGSAFDQPLQRVAAQHAAAHAAVQSASPKK